MYREVYVCVYEKGVWEMYKVNGILCGKVCESKRYECVRGVREYLEDVELFGGFVSYD